MTDNYLPEVFEINYKHEFNETKSIKLINNALLVNDPNPKLIDIDSISEEKWMEFWYNIEKIGLWNLERGSYRLYIGRRIYLECENHLQFKGTQ